MILGLTDFLCLSTSPRYIKLLLWKQMKVILNITVNQTRPSWMYPKTMLLKTKKQHKMDTTILKQLPWRLYQVVQSITDSWAWHPSFFAPLVILVYWGHLWCDLSWWNKISLTGSCRLKRLTVHHHCIEQLTCVWQQIHLSFMGLGGIKSSSSSSGISSSRYPSLISCSFTSWLGCKNKKHPPS